MIARRSEPSEVMAARMAVVIVAHLLPRPRGVRLDDQIFRCAPSARVGRDSELAQPHLADDLIVRHHVPLQMEAAGIIKS